MHGSFPYAPSLDETLKRGYIDPGLIVQHVHSILVHGTKCSSIIMSLTLGDLVKS